MNPKNPENPVHPVKTTHTPDPWHAAELDDPQYSHEISGPDVHMGFLPVWPVAADEMRANARLIAAAPNLLAALSDLVSALECDAVAMSEHDIEAMTGGHDNNCAFCAARAAIAKAKGEG